MKKIFGIICFVAVLFAGQNVLADPLHFNFSNVENARILFPGDTTFNFVPGVGGFDYEITGQTGFANNTLLTGLFGNIGGSYTIGAITTFMGVSTAPVTGTGTFSIDDGAGFDFTATLDWVSITQVGTAGSLNTSGVVNLTGFSYGGSNADLVELLTHPSAIEVLTFQFVPAVALSTLKTSGPNQTSYSGSVDTPVAEPASLFLLGMGIMGIGIAGRRLRK